MSLGDARGSGRLANDDAVAVAYRSVVSGGPGEGRRIVDVRVWDGVDLRVLPDRGLDLGQAWYAGVPLAWVSTVGETGPLDDLTGLRWSQGFGGGLLVTCGLRNVGRPSEGHGLHGTFSHLAATDVDVEREFDGDDATITVTGVVSDDAGPAPLRVVRTIRTHAGVGHVEVTDRVTNLGDDVTEAPLLYHFNFGYPLWAPGALLDIAAVDTIPRDPVSEAALDRWREPPEVERTGERVLEHVVDPVDGWGTASIVNEDVGIGVAVRWRVADLPRLHQWIDPNPGMSVLGIEPANCSTSGRAHDRADGRLPMLGAGETRETAVSVDAWSL